MKKNENKIMNGVFYMQSNMSAGVDFRFAKDGYSIMLNFDYYYSASNVTQMVGRSTRKQGIQAGHCFCNDNVEVDDEPTIDFLKGREKQPGDDNGPLYAKAMVDHFY